MIISEAEEALYCCIPFSFNDIKNANTKLMATLKNTVKSDSKTMYIRFKEQFIPESSVEHFNISNIYFNDHTENTRIEEAE